MTENQAQDHVICSSFKFSNALDIEYWLCSCLMIFFTSILLSCRTNDRWFFERIWNALEQQVSFQFRYLCRREEDLMSMQSMVHERKWQAEAKYTCVVRKLFAFHTRATSQSMASRNASQQFNPLVESSETHWFDKVYKL